MKDQRLPFQDPALPLGERVQDLLSRLTLDEKIELVHQFQPAVPRLGIPAYKHGTEAAHGVAWLGRATSFPQPLGLASTWDPDLMTEVGRAIGEEARGFFRRDPALNGLTLWAPTVDLERDPRWGRTEEAYGEDPFLVGEVASALVRGIQGDHPTVLRAAATLKHFLANNHEEDRGTCSASLDPRNLHEYYHQSFERVFRRAGAVSMMTAYNAVNGVPCNLNPDVQVLAKDRWGCQFVVSDAGDVVGTNREHGWFATLAEAVAANLKAGIDSITDDRESCLAAVREALTLGLLTEADLDRAVGNSFAVRIRLGEFDPSHLYDALGEEQIGSPEHRRVALRAARQAVVLLKNEGNLLPLSGTLRVAVVGPLADQQLRDWYSGEPLERSTLAQVLKQRLGPDRVLTASGADLVQLSSLGRAIGTAADGVTLAAGAPIPLTFELEDWGWTNHTLRDQASGLYVTTDDRTLRLEAREVWGWFTKEVVRMEGDTLVRAASWDGRPVSVGSSGTLEVGQGPSGAGGRIGIDAGTSTQGLGTAAQGATPLDLQRVRDGRAEAFEAARASDLAVVVVGNHPLINAKETIDRTSLDLPASQVALVKAVAAAGRPVVLVVVSGYPYALDEVLPYAAAIVHTTHAGPDLGRALADTLWGIHNPSGRLPMTWYHQGEVLAPIADYDVMRGGRTYRWFAGRALFPFGHGLSYSSFAYQRLERTGPLTFEVTVTNQSARAGEEVVQFYLSLANSPVPRPRKQLVAFRRIALEPGQTGTVAVDLDPADLARWDVVRGAWTTDPGTAVLSAGASSEDLRLGVEFAVEGPEPALRSLAEPTEARNFDDHLEAVLEYGSEGPSAVTAAWLRFDRWEATARPRTVEVRVRSSTERTIEFRLGGPEGPLAASVTVGAGAPWQSVTAPFDWPDALGDLWVLCPGTPTRNEGLAWFRFGS